MDTLHHQIDHAIERLRIGELAHFDLWSGHSIGIVMTVECSYKVFGVKGIELESEGELRSFMTGLMLGAKAARLIPKDEALSMANQISPNK